MIAKIRKKFLNFALDLKVTEIKKILINKNMEKFNAQGAGVALITPFKDDLSIDFKALESIVNYIIKHNADYIVVLGTTGESALLSTWEKKEILRIVKETCAERVPLVFGYGGLSTKEMIEKLPEYNLEGYSALLTVTPFYLKPSQEGLFEHYRLIADSSPLPVILYNVPGRTGVNMLSSLTLKIANEVKNVMGIKEASGRLFQIEEILKDRPENFRVLSGDDALTFHLATLGADGVISVMANAFPDKVHAIITNCRNGNIKKAREIHYQLKGLNKLLFSDGNPSGIKYLMSKLGLCKNILRLPLTPVTDATARDIDREIASIL